MTLPPPDMAFDDSGPFSQHLADHFDGYTGVNRELLEFLCGQRLGYGMSREVFIWRPDPKYVLKVELKGHTFQNVAEIEAWQTVEHCPDHAKWFAPIKAISACGRFLLQRRPNLSRQWRFRLKCQLILPTLSKRISVALVSNS